MNNNVAMQMLSFNFTELVFELNKAFVWPKAPISIDPIIEKKIKKIDKNKVEVSLFFRIEDLEKKPFNCRVTLVGVFVCPNWESDEAGKILVNLNTVNILFPYLRQAVTNLTTTAGVPPYVLPIINTQNIRNKEE